MIDQIVRSKRKTLAIEVTKQGEVVVRAPLRVSDRRIAKFVRDHADWIARTRSDMIAKVEIGQKRYEPGEQFLYLGRRYPFESFVFGEEVDEPRVHFESWYRDRAKRLIPSRCELIASQHGYDYAKVRVSSAKRIWGSCSGKNSISISWRTVMAPLECVDYVILHELVHTLHKHHGKWFWRRVERAMPDYKTHRKWLRDNEHLMSL